ncbi:hypothetical protein TNCV_1388651 [Trichonephila clavipes]|nr:hypothetical protein TNCV_1388651 [Trichonephila clavipes]
MSRWLPPKCLSRKGKKSLNLKKVEVVMFASYARSCLGSSSSALFTALNRSYRLSCVTYKISPHPNPRGLVPTPEPYNLFSSVLGDKWVEPPTVEANSFSGFEQSCI